MTGETVLMLLVLLTMAAWLLQVVYAVYTDYTEQKKRGELSEFKALFDERQRIARLRAGVHALYALVGYMVLWAVLDLTGRFAWTGDVFPLAVGGLFLAMTVWKGGCILHDAEIGWNQKNSAGYTVIWQVWAVNLSIQCLLHFRKEKITPVIVIAGMCVCLFVLEGILFYVKRHRKKTPAAGEDDTL